MDMNIEMDKNTATDSITSRLADARNDLGITQKDLAIISSIDTPKTAANTTRLSRVGIATPCCHLYTACGVANPNISARSFTERPALILSLVMCHIYCRHCYHFSSCSGCQSTPSQQPGCTGGATLMP